MEVTFTFDDVPEIPFTLSPLSFDEFTSRLIDWEHARFKNVPRYYLLGGEVAGRVGPASVFFSLHVAPRPFAQGVIRVKMDQLQRRDDKFVKSCYARILTPHSKSLVLDFKKTDAFAMLEA